MSDGGFRRLSRALAELFGLITLRIVYGKDRRAMIDTPYFVVIFLGLLSFVWTAGILGLFFEEISILYLIVLDAFERSYHMFYAHTENIYELALNEEYVELHKICMQEQNIPCSLAREHIPWLLGFEKAAQEELKRLHDLWPDVRDKLINNGVCS